MEYAIAITGAIRVNIAKLSKRLKYINKNLTEYITNATNTIVPGIDAEAFNCIIIPNSSVSKFARSPEDIAIMSKIDWFMYITATMKKCKVNNITTLRIQFCSILLYLALRSAIVDIAILIPIYISVNSNPIAQTINRA